MMNPKVDEFIDKAKKWQAELTALRTIILDCMLTEDFKWKQPCYTYQNANVVLIHGFKEYCAIMFFKGALLSNDKGILIQQTENVQSTRQIRFTSIKEIAKMKPILKAYIFEAIEIEKAGLKVEMKKSTDLEFPKEFKEALKKNATLKKAFEALTPGRQRAYNLYFSAPKQSKTIETRIEKYTDKIIKGIGFNDCTCGLSQKMPYCDGSHKQLR
jgi:uncharacterized protein YdeI (YjbR/CyaY-like superfamily)